MQDNADGRNRGKVTITYTKTTLLATSRPWMNR